MFQVNKQSISEQVLNYLRKEILLGNLPEGFHLKETELSKQLNVSRGPVREALVLLEVDDFVKTGSNGRTLVQKFDIEDVQHLYETRILLETYALKNVTKKDIDHEIVLLKEYISGMEKSNYLDEHHIESDILFHLTLIKLSENKTLFRLWNSLNGIVRTLVTVTSKHTNDRKSEILDEHKNIVSAIETRDFNHAAKILERHLKDASNYYSEAIFQLEKSSETNE